MSVLALARTRLALSRGTVPSAVPAGQTPSGETNGTPGTLGTGGTAGTAGTVRAAGIVCGGYLDCDPIEDGDAIAERAALAADSVPARYLDAWARLQCHRPCSVDPEAWRRTIDDAGLFLDFWGAHAATLEWMAGDLFDVPRAGRAGGLLWQLKGAHVEALDAAQARLSDGRTIRRAEMKRPD
jgi:hypothetical protein